MHSLKASWTRKLNVCLSHAMVNLLSGLLILCDEMHDGQRDATSSGHQASPHLQAFDSDGVEVSCDEMRENVEAARFSLSFTCRRPSSQLA